MQHVEKVYSDLHYPGFYLRKGLHGWVRLAPGYACGSHEAMLHEATPFVNVEVALAFKEALEKLTARYDAPIQVFQVLRVHPNIDPITQAVVQPSMPDWFKDSSI